MLKVTTMNHIEVYELEREWNRGSGAWARYVRDVKLFLKTENEDGDEVRDGYSLDTMYKAFRAGLSSADYARGTRAE